LDHPDKADSSDAAKKPGDVDGREGTTPPKLPGVSDRQRALAAQEGNTKAHRKAREKVVKAFLAEHGREWDGSSYQKPTTKQIQDQMKGHDLSKPVKVGPPPDCPSPQYQYQRQFNPRRQGSYYGGQDSRPTDLGIAGYDRGPDGRYRSKIQQPHTIDPNAPYLESTAAPVGDFWSVDGQTVDTRGGHTQRVIGDRAAAKPF
jgi:hypothetical protein